MIKFFRQAYNNNKKIIENFSYLTLLQLFTMLSPLIVYPYLIRTVGLNLYGVVIFAQTIVTYFSLVINFGFGISGPKDVAITRENTYLLSKQVSSIYFIKSVLWILCFIIYLIIIFSIGFFKEHRLLFVLTYFVTLSDVLFPLWFFQGIEKMKYITYINVFVRSLFIIAVFIFIKKASDYLYIPILNSVGALLSGIISIFIIFKKENVKFILVPKGFIIHKLKEGFVLFISSVSIKLYMNLNKIIVGTFLGMSEVAIYDLGEKIISILKTPLMMISQAIFPKISRDKVISYINNAMFFVTGIVVIVYLGLFFSSGILVQFFLGHESIIALNIVRILGVSLIFLSFNMFLGGLRLIPFGYNKEYMVVMVANGVFYVLIMAGLWLFQFINIYSITSAYVLVEIFCTGFLYFMNKRLKLI